MARYAQRLISEKLETVAGTPEATAATDAILARNVTLRNLEAEYQQQDFARGTEGAQGEDVHNVHAGAEYDVEAAFGATSTVPAYAHLLQSSGMAMADDDGDTVFTPTAEGVEIPTCTLQMRNGALMQNVAGVRGSFSFTAETGQNMFAFTLGGQHLCVSRFSFSDGRLPAPMWSRMGIM